MYSKHPIPWDPLMMFDNEVIEPLAQYLVPGVAEVPETEKILEYGYYVDPE